MASSHIRQVPNSEGSARSSPVSSTPSTTVTTPDQSPGADDDIWDTSSDHRPAGAENQDIDNDVYGGRHGGEILSDIPTIRRQHMTDGYREGLAVGKAQVMQSGFDAGYPFGVDLGLRVGTILGVLEGIIAAMKKATQATTTSLSELEFVTKLHDRAQRDLKISELMKALDDEKIAALKDGDSFPAEVEAVVRRWEELVLTSVELDIAHAEDAPNRPPVAS